MLLYTQLLPMAAQLRCMAILLYQRAASNVASAIVRVICVLVSL